MNNSDLTPDQVARLEADGQSPEKVRGERVEIEKMYDSLIGKLVSYHPEADVALIRRTFEYAYDKHLLQRRKSGEPYIIHPLGVAKLVSQLKLDEASICAALLHAHGACTTWSKIPTRRGTTSSRRLAPKLRIWSTR